MRKVHQLKCGKKLRKKDDGLGDAYKEHVSDMAKMDDFFRRRGLFRSDHHIRSSAWAHQG